MQAMRVLLLAGGGGHGKSKVGNWLLNKDEFDSPDYVEEITIKIGCNDEFKVIDTHGLFEEQKDIDVVFNRAEDAVMGRESGTSSNETYFNFNQSPSCLNDVPCRNTHKIVSEAQLTFDDKNTGFDAILIVIKYGIRYTKQDLEAVNQIKLVFGEEILKKRGIVVFTFGESCENDNALNKFINTKDSCLKKLIDEVQHRYILKYNDTTTQAVKKLIDLIQVKERYTPINFLENASTISPERIEIKCKRLKEQYVRNSSLANFVKSVENLVGLRDYLKTLQTSLRLNVPQNEETSKLLILDLVDSFDNNVKITKSKLNGVRTSLKKRHNCFWKLYHFMCCCFR